LEETMYIVLQRSQEKLVGDTLVIDTVEGHRETRDRLLIFLGAGDQTLVLQAAGKCPLLPDAEVLDALRFVKTGGRIHTGLAPDRVLQVSGRPDQLLRYANEFQFEADGGHHHPEQVFEPSELHPQSEMIILEATDELDKCV
jgi:hypothetical protein